MDTKVRCSECGSLNYQKDGKYCFVCESTLDWENPIQEDSPNTLDRQNAQSGKTHYGTINCTCGKEFYFETVHLEVECIGCGLTHDVSTYPFKEEIDEDVTDI
jgi:hypothetical protein